MSISLFFPDLEKVQTLQTTPKNLSKHTQKWHSAFVTIYCFRALLSRFRSPLLLTPNKNIHNPKLSSSSPHTAIDILDDFAVTKTTLTNLVKNKNEEALQNLGGVRGVVDALRTNVENGVQGGGGGGDDDVMRRRLDAFGSNTYPKPPTRGFSHFVMEDFKEPTILILLVCAALSLAFGIKEKGIQEGWYEGGSIFVAVFLVIAVSSISNFRQSRQFDKLSQVSNNIQVDVVRSGRRQQVPIYDIVVGDVVLLKIGDRVPADGLFLEGHSLQVDESSMTGESDHVEINSHKNPFLFSGTKVADGFAKMVVTSVGTNTTWGEMMGSISRENINEETPLQERLNKLTSVIDKVGSALAFITVVAIPEGLPLAMPLRLPYSSWKKQMADNALVRKLSALETMGSATTICTDKTGRLTLNQMKVTKFWLGERPMEKKKPNESSLHDSDVLELIKEGIALNTTGSVYKSKSTNSEHEFSGSPTEKAILSWAVLDLHMNMEELRQNSPILHVEPFNSKKKRSGVLIRRKADKKMHAHWKGAAEMVLRLCSKYYDASSNIKDLDNDKKFMFEQIIQEMAASSLRCVAFAHTEVADEEIEGGIKKVKEGGLTLLGLVGIEDPCRRDVKKAVQDCQQAGVSVKMITGDNIFTAKAIATECGIIQPNQDTKEAVIEGEVFRNLSPEERLKRVEKICVVAGSSPSDKRLLVHCLKKKGHVVAVIGDGTNDAPALKEADIGIFLGIQGAEVAKESSDIIILDDNFASVTTVLKWGICVHNNIRKFIQFQLTVNVAALAINFVAAVSAGEVPLTAVQLLWVNLIVDILGALALTTENPTMELLKKPPVRRSEPLITNIMWRNLLAQALYQITILLTLQFKGEAIFGVSSEVNETLIFNTFVLCQVFNEFNARKLEEKNVFQGIHRNKLFMGIIGITLVLQVLMVEFLKNFADTERLNWGQWGACILMAAMSWPIGCAVKFIPVP